MAAAVRLPCCHEDTRPEAARTGVAWPLDPPMVVGGRGAVVAEVVEVAGAAVVEEVVVVDVDGGAVVVVDDVVDDDDVVVEVVGAGAGWSVVEVTAPVDATVDVWTDPGVEGTADVVVTPASAVR